MADFDCDYSDQVGDHGAQFLVTNLEDGDVQKLCAVHLPTWAASLLEALGCTVTMPVPEDAPEASQEAVTGPDPSPAKSDQEPAGEVPAELQAAASPFPDATPDDR